MIKNWLEMTKNYKLKYKKDKSHKAFEDIDFNLLRKTSERFDGGENAIDDITWRDLEMHKVFSKINKTYTLPGEELLFHWMKTPTQNTQDYLKRQEKLKTVEAYGKALEKDLDDVGNFEYDYRGLLLETEVEKKKDQKPKLIYSSLILMILLFKMTSASIFIFGACLSILAIILFHYVYTANHKHKIESFGYMVKVTSFYAKNKSLIKTLYSDVYNLEKLDDFVKEMGKFKNAFNELDGMNPIKDIGVVLSMTTYRRCIAVEKILSQNKIEMLSIADLLGEIDLCQAVNHYRNEKNFSQPVLLDDMKSLSLKGSYNILIENCIPNDIEIKNSIVITGSNMGGKSSFLRQVGSSIVLSQALCFSPSSKHLGGFFNVISSISLNDDIESGKSYFMKEAEAIKRMLDKGSKHENTLMLIDEIFKGTNPIERLSASVEILNRLALNHKVMVTTHDIGILQDLVNYEFYHFEHDISKSKMSFDYKIKKGVTEVRNAVKLMEYIKYPEEVIKSINDRILKMNAFV